MLADKNSSINRKVMMSLQQILLLHFSLDFYYYIVNIYITINYHKCSSFQIQALG